MKAGPGQQILSRKMQDILRTHSNPVGTFTRVFVPRGIKVRLHSNDPSAVEATDNTLKMIPMGGNAHLLRVSGDRAYLDKDGFAYVQTTNEDFIRFALKQQGYVKEVL